MPGSFSETRMPFTRTEKPPGGPGHWQPPRRRPQFELDGRWVNLKLQKERASSDLQSIRTPLGINLSSASILSGC
jgi:hypothetical protein